MCMVGIRPDCPCGLHFHISCYQHFPVDFIKLGLAWNEKAESLRLCSADLKKNRKQKTKKDSNHPKSWLWEQIGVYIQFLASLYTYSRHEAQLWCPGVCAAHGFLWQTLGTDCSVHSALATCLWSAMGLSPCCTEVYSGSVSVGKAETLLCPWSTSELWQALCCTSNLGQRWMFSMCFSPVGRIYCCQLDKVSTSILFNATEIAQQSSNLEANRKCFLFARVNDEMLFVGRGSLSPLPLAHPELLTYQLTLFALDLSLCP